jgi:chemotaxis protein MotB
MGHRTSRRPARESLDVWPGFVDIMVGLLLIFIFFATLFVITETILARSLDKKDTELERVSKEMAAKDQLLARTNSQVDTLKQEVTRLESLFQGQVKKTASLEELIAATTKQLNETKEDSEKKGSLLKDKEQALAEQAKLIDSARVDSQTKSELLAAKMKELESALARLSQLTDLVRANDDRHTSQTKELVSIRADLKEKLALLDAKDKGLVEALVKIKDLDSLLKTKDEQLVSTQAQSQTAVSDLEAKINQIRELSKKLAGMELRLAETDESLAQTRKDSSDKFAQISRLKTQLEGLNSNIAALTGKISEYVAQISALNRRLAESKEREDQSSAKASSLQKDVVSLTAKLDEISAGTAKQDKPKDPKEEFRLSQLVDTLGQKEKEIDRLRKLAKYRSEFLAKLDEIFRGVPDIKVQGDRFVFQSEILFKSGKKDINEGGKEELDKFIRIYKEMAPKIPKDIDLVIQIQGHTDTDPLSPGSKFQSNWELASARAMEVVRYMIREGIPPRHLGAVALGEFQPVAQENTPEAKRLNRRIEIKIATL